MAEAENRAERAHEHLGTLFAVNKAARKRTFSPGFEAGEQPAGGILLTDAKIGYFKIETDSHFF